LKVILQTFFIAKFKGEIYTEFTSESTPLPPEKKEEKNPL
jgi:hypothetical protein